jgi:hypothetical protein
MGASLCTCLFPIVGHYVPFLVSRKFLECEKNVARFFVQCDDKNKAIIRLCFTSMIT